MKKTERIMHRAPRSAARASRARTAMCDSNGKCVTGSYFISVTQLPYIFQSLTPMCDMCDMCDSFSEFILELVSNTVLFLKKNFNLKTPVTPVTHCPLPVTQQEYRTNRGPYFTNIGHYVH